MLDERGSAISLQVLGRCARAAGHAWTRVGRRQVSSITLARGHVGIDRARSLRATTGSTGHRCRNHGGKKHAAESVTHVLKKKMRPQHALISSHKLPIGRFLGAGFGRRLLALRQVHSRPAGRLTCRVRVRHDDFRRSETTILSVYISFASAADAKRPPHPIPIPAHPSPATPRRVPRWRPVLGTRRGGTDHLP